MKNIIVFAIFVLAFSVTAFAQDGSTGAKSGMNSKGQPVVKNKSNEAVELRSGEVIKRGEALEKGIKYTSIERALKDPSQFADKKVAVTGIVVRSCKKEGCWAEVADMVGGKSIRVTFGDHKFFIPVNAAGMNIKLQGVFVTRTLDKEHVDHLINDDGAKFESRNEDGSVTEVSFDAVGVELSK